MTFWASLQWVRVPLLAWHPTRLFVGGDVAEVPRDMWAQHASPPARTLRAVGETAELRHRRGHG